MTETENISSLSEISKTPSEMAGSQTSLSVKSILSLPSDTDKFTFNHGDQIENAYAFNEYLRANIEHGKTLTMTKAQILGLIKKLATTLSCGGLDSLPMVCLGVDCIRHATCPLASSGVVVPTGEVCQPPGETVRTVRGVKNIEHLDQTIDKVISFDIHAGREREKTFKSKGRSFSLHQRYYSGMMYTLYAGSKHYRCTAGHITIAKWNNRSKDLFVVYLMQKGNFFRVGKTKLWMIEKTGKTHFGLAHRARSEQADRAWILGVYQTNTEALLSEEAFSIRFSAPKSCFRATVGRKKTKHNGLYAWVTQEQLNSHFSIVCKPIDYYAGQLNSIGKDIRYPFWEYDPSNKTRTVGLVNSGKIRACNIIPGVMDLPVIDEYNVLNWYAVSTSVEYYTGPVFNLDVDVEHTYITGDIVTHNCPVEKAELANHVRRLGKDFEDLPTYADQLLVQGVAACEIIKSRVYSDMSATPDAVISVGKGVDKFGNAILDRTDNPNYRIWASVNQTEQKLLKSLHMTLDQRKKLDSTNSKRDPSNLRAVYRKRLQEIKQRNKSDIDVIDIVPQSITDEILGETNAKVNDGSQQRTTANVNGSNVQPTQEHGAIINGNAGDSREGITPLGGAKKLITKLNEITKRAGEQNTSQPNDSRRAKGPANTKPGPDDSNMEVVV